MSVFLMGVYDQSRRQWCTVARCGNGHDDATIMKLQRELKMKRINKVTSSPTFHQLHHRTCCAHIPWYSVMLYEDSCMGVISHVGVGV